MADLKYQPVTLDHEEFINRAVLRKEFKEVYDGLDPEYALIRVENSLTSALFRRARERFI